MFNSNFLHHLLWESSAKKNFLDWNGNQWDRACLSGDNAVYEQLLEATEQAMACKNCQGNHTWNLTAYNCLQQNCVLMTN